MASGMEVEEQLKKDTMTRFIFFGGLFLIIIFLPKWADSVYGMEAEEFLKELPHEEKTYEEKISSGRMKQAKACRGS